MADSIAAYMMTPSNLSSGYPSSGFLALALALLALATLTPLRGGVGGACPPDVPWAWALGWLWRALALGSRGSGCRGWGGGPMRGPLGATPGPPGQDAGLCPSRRWSLGPLWLGPSGRVWAWFPPFSGPFGCSFGLFSGGSGPGFSPYTLCLGGVLGPWGSPFSSLFGLFFGCFSGVLWWFPGSLSAPLGPCGPKPGSPPPAPPGPQIPCFRVFFGWFSPVFGPFSGVFGLRPKTPSGAPVGPSGPWGSGPGSGRFLASFSGGFGSLFPGSARDLGLWSLFSPRALRALFWAPKGALFGLFLPVFGPFGPENLTFRLYSKVGWGPPVLALLGP